MTMMNRATSMAPNSSPVVPEADVPGLVLDAVQAVDRRLDRVEQDLLRLVVDLVVGAGERLAVLVVLVGAGRDDPGRRRDEQDQDEEDRVGARQRERRASPLAGLGPVADAASRRTSSWDHSSCHVCALPTRCRIGSDDPCATTASSLVSITSSIASSTCCSRRSRILVTSLEVSSAAVFDLRRWRRRACRWPARASVSPVRAVDPPRSPAGRAPLRAARLRLARAAGPVLAPRRS